MRRWSSLLLVVMLAACSGDEDSSSSTTDSTEPPDTVTPIGSTPIDTAAAAEDDLPVLEDVTSPEWKPATRSEELGLEIDEAQQVTLQMAIDAVALVEPEFP